MPRGSRGLAALVPRVRWPRSIWRQNIRPRRPFVMAARYGAFPAAPGAIGADERDEVIPSRHGGEVLHEHSPGHLHAEAVDSDHLVAAALGRLKAEVHRRRITRWRRQARKPLEPLALPDVLLFLRHVCALLLGANGYRDAQSTPAERLRARYTGGTAPVFRIRPTPATRRARKAAVRTPGPAAPGSAPRRSPRRCGCP